MARRSSARAGVALSDAQVLEHLGHTLSTLRVLCDAFDAGTHGTAFSMATEVSKALTSNSVVVRLRGERKFRTLRVPSNEQNLAPEMKLVAAKIYGDGRVEFVRSAAYTAENTVQLVFREWWNRDVIHRASAAKSGSPPGQIPLLLQDQVPYRKRAVLVRSRLVELMRNKLGAHIDDESPELLEELQRADSFAVLQVQSGDRVFSTNDGSLKVMVGPCAAMMRIVAGEVLDAYDGWQA